MTYNMPFLKAVADKLDIKYGPNSKEHNLKKIINTKLAGYHTSIEEWEKKDMLLEDIDNFLKETPVDDSYVDPEVARLSGFSFEEADKQKHKKEKDNLYKKAMKLVRVQIACNDPNKREWEGEIFTVRNASLPEVKKYVPFNVPTHVPQILLNMIKEKELQTFVSSKAANGTVTKKSRLIPMYAIQELPPLTAQELEAIKRKQLVEKQDQASSSLLGV